MLLSPNTDPLTPARTPPSLGPWLPGVVLFGNLEGRRPPRPKSCGPPSWPPPSLADTPADRSHSLRRPRRLERADCALRGAAVGLRRAPHPQPPGRPRDVVQETFIGFLTSLPNYDSRRPLESYLFSIARPQADRPPASRRAAADVALGARGHHTQQLGAGRLGPAGQQHPPQRRAPAPGRGSPGSRPSASSWTTGANAAIGKSSSASSCCSCAAGATRRWPRRWTSPSRRVANHKFEFLARLRKAVRQQRTAGRHLPRAVREGVTADASSRSGSLSGRSSAAGRDGADRAGSARPPRASGASGGDQTPAATRASTRWGRSGGVTG